MSKYITNAKGGLLGRVTHYVIRYEVQQRGSLHAHIILWLHPEDVSRVSAEIVANVPAEFVPLDPTDQRSTGEFRTPTCPEQAQLSEIVQRKQLHRCGDVSDWVFMCAMH